MKEQLNKENIELIVAAIKPMSSPNVAVRFGKVIVAPFGEENNRTNSYFSSCQKRRINYDKQKNAGNPALPKERV